MRTDAITTSAASTPDPDTRITLSQAARVTPGKSSPNSIWRWARKGVRARDGQRVRLEHERVGGRLYTTRRWLEEFTERLTAADIAHFDSADAPSPASTRRVPVGDQAERRARIQAELDAEGL